MKKLAFVVSNRNFTWTGPSGRDYTFIRVRGSDNVFEVDDQDAPALLAMYRQRCCGQAGRENYFQEVG